jgi:hypothetical protein
MLVIHVFPETGFIQQIETDFLRGGVLIAFRPHVPMEAEGVKCFLIFPEIIGLVKSGIDAVARRSMEVQTDVHIVFMCKLHEVADGVNAFIADFVYVVWCDVARSVDIEVVGISHRESYEIESPITHPFEGQEKRSPAD